MGSKLGLHLLTWAARSLMRNENEMTFESDPKKFRTFDVPSGWELLVEARSGKNHKFRMLHADGTSFVFVGVLESVEAVQGSPDQCLKIWRLLLGSGSEWSARKQLIEEALVAYGTVFNGPNGPVSCLFE
jgi:hypothetical protein